MVTARHAVVFTRIEIMVVHGSVSSLVTGIRMPTTLTYRMEVSLVVRPLTLSPKTSISITIMAGISAQRLTDPLHLDHDAILMGEVDDNGTASFLRKAGDEIV